MRLKYGDSYLCKLDLHHQIVDLRVERKTMELILGCFSVFSTRKGQKRDRPERLVVRQLDVSHRLLDDCTLETLIKNIVSYMF